MSSTRKPTGLKFVKAMCAKHGWPAHCSMPQQLQKGTFVWVGGVPRCSQATKKANSQIMITRNPTCFGILGESLNEPLKEPLSLKYIMYRYDLGIGTWQLTPDHEPFNVCGITSLFSGWRYLLSCSYVCGDHYLRTSTGWLLQRKTI